MKCPECGNNAIPFVKVWLAGPLSRLNCPGCQAKLRVHKTGISRFSSYAFGVSIAALIGLGVLDVYWNSIVFAAAIAFLVILDFLIDKKFVRLKKKTCPNGIANGASHGASEGN